MLATAADSFIDSPSRQMVQRTSPIMPANVFSFVARPQRQIVRFDRFAAMEERKRANLVVSGERS